MGRDGAGLLLLSCELPALPQDKISREEGRGRVGSSWCMESYEHKQMLQADARLLPAYLSNYFRR